MSMISNCHVDDSPINEHSALVSATHTVSITQCDMSSPPIPCLAPRQKHCAMFSRRETQHNTDYSLYFELIPCDIFQVFLEPKHQNFGTVFRKTSVPLALRRPREFKFRFRHGPRRRALDRRQRSFSKVLHICKSCLMR
jgi:hypothetical protein